MSILKKYTLMSTLCQGMVSSTFNSSPSMSKLKKSTWVWLMANRMEYKGKHWTVAIGESDKLHFILFSMNKVLETNSPSFAPHSIKNPPVCILK